MRRPIVAAALALALHPSTGRAQSGGSRNCAPPKSFHLGNDTYRGSFVVDLEFQGGPAQMGLDLENKVHGDLELACAEGGAIRNVEGTVVWWLGGRGTSGSIVASALDFTGTGRLQKGRYRTNGFEVRADLAVPGSVSVTVSPPDGAGSGGGGAFTGSGPIDLQFTAVEFSCDGAQGTFTSTQIQQTIDGLAAQGFAVKGDGVGRWQVSAPGERTEDLLKDLRQRLGPLPPPGADRKVELERLNAIESWIRRDLPPRVLPCLWEAWLLHTRQVLAQWVGEEARELERYRGDLETLQPILARAFAVDRSLVLLGMDECEAPLHQRMWDAIGPAYEKLILRLIATKATPADIMAPLREAVLLGVVSPALRERAEAAILRRLRKQADADWAAYQSIRREAGKPGRCRPDVVLALQEAVRSEGTYVLNGGELNRAMAEVESSGDCPSAQTKTETRP